MLHPDQMQDNIVRKAILIVEDHEEVRSILHHFFTSEGFTVLLACHGQEALGLLQRESTLTPDVILTDSRMPVMNGPAFLLELLQTHPTMLDHTSVFIMSAGDDYPLPDLKITGFVKKHFDFDELYNQSARYRV